MARRSTGQKGQFCISRFGGQCEISLLLKAKPAYLLGTRTIYGSASQSWQEQHIALMYLTYPPIGSITVTDSPGFSPDSMIY